MALIWPILQFKDSCHVLFGGSRKPEIIFRNYKVRERFVRYYAMIIS